MQVEFSMIFLMDAVSLRHMKNFFLVLLLFMGQSLLGQQNLGIRNSNYAGIQGALINPGSIADSKLAWDVNVISFDEVFDNTFLYVPKQSLHFLGFRHIIKGAIDENLFQTHYNPENPNQLFNLTFSTETLGPSFFMKLAKKHEIGFTLANRSYVNIKNIPGHVAENAFAYFLETDLWNTEFTDASTRLNAMNWVQYGFHYATVLYRDGNNQLKGGLSLNYLQGIAAAYTKNTNITYKIVDTTSMLFYNTNADYGRTNYDDFRHASNFGDLTHGHGFGMDIGFTFVRLKDQETENAVANTNSKSYSEHSDYVYRIGLSFLDIGAINFNRNSASYHLEADSANFENWHEIKFHSNIDLDKALSAVFYNGDSTQSLTADHFKMAMPSAISIQFDWNVYEQFFANMTIIKGFGHVNKQGVVRPDVYSITPRYETKWGEVSLPFSVINYNQWRARLGFAFRIAYFFFGGDAPGSLLKLKDLNGVDFYAGIDFFIVDTKRNHDGIFKNL